MSSPVVVTALAATQRNVGNMPHRAKQRIYILVLKIVSFNKNKK